MNMIRTIPLVTDRLYLRQFTEADIQPAYDNWMSDDDVTEFLSWNTHRNIHETTEIINSWIRSYGYGTMDWCIVRRSTGEPIGSITAVQDFPEQRYCEIGYCIGKDHWGKGLMTEAVKTVTRCIFDTTNYLWVQARCDAENSASRRCLEKSKFKTMGTIHTPCVKKNGEIRKYLMFRMDRSDVLSF